VAVAVELSARFEAARVTVHPGWLLAALLPALLGVLVQAVAFGALLERLAGRPLPWLDLTSMYLDAQMARYTPGKVGLLAVRVAAAARLGVSARLMVGSLMVELSSWVGMGVLVGFLTLVASATFVPMGAGSFGSVSAEVRLLAAVLASSSLLGLLALCFLPQRRVPQLLRRLLSLSEDQTELARPLLPLVLPLWHALHWSCWVLSGAILALGLGANVEQAALAGGVLCLAVVLGFLAVVAPAGAGVREVVISVGTAPFLGPSAALVLGLTARGVSLLSDFVCFATLRLLVLRGSRERA